MSQQTDSFIYLGSVSCETNPCDSTTQEINRRITTTNRSCYVLANPSPTTPNTTKVQLFKTQPYIHMDPKPRLQKICSEKGELEEEE